MNIKVLVTIVEEDGSSTHFTLKDSNGRWRTIYNKGMTLTPVLLETISKLIPPNVAIWGMRGVARRDHAEAGIGTSDGKTWRIVITPEGDSS